MRRIKYLLGEKERISKIKKIGIYMDKRKISDETQEEKKQGENNEVSWKWSKYLILKRAYFQECNRDLCRKRVRLIRWCTESRIWSKMGTKEKRKKNDIIKKRSNKRRKKYQLKGINCCRKPRDDNGCKYCMLLCNWRFDSSCAGQALLARRLRQVDTV